MLVEWLECIKVASHEQLLKSPIPARLRADGVALQEIE